MPTYDYRCTECADTFEMQLYIADRKIPLETPCKKCGGKLDRAVGTPAVIDPVVLGVTKPKEGFRQLLRQIEKKNPVPQKSRYTDNITEI